MRGRSITEGELAAKTGEPREALARLCRGDFFDETALLKVAKALDLDEKALLGSASKSWYPRQVNIPTLAIFNTPYRDMRVNAFLIWDPATKKAACFDTGTDGSGIIETVEREELTVENIFLTHTHNDHIADLDRLSKGLGNPDVYSNRLEPWPSTIQFTEGDTFSIGELTIDTLTTSGHSVGGNHLCHQWSATPHRGGGRCYFCRIYGRRNHILQRCLGKQFQQNPHFAGRNCTLSRARADE